MRLRVLADQSMLWPEARRASPRRWQGDGKDLLTCDGSGLSSSALCETFAPAGSWQRTLSESLLSSLKDSTGCAVSLRLRATKSGRSLLVPTTSGRRTGGSESGSWPTATVQDCHGHAQLSRDPTPGQTGGTTLPGAVIDAEGLWATATAHPRTHSPRPVHHGEQLANQVEKVEGLWATPQVWDGTKENKQHRPGRQNGVTYQVFGLLAQRSHSTSGKRPDWPTAQAMDVLPQRSAAALAKAKAKGGCSNLREHPALGRGVLNSRWVAQLMGYASDWCALPSDVLDALTVKPSKRTATRSSRRQQP
jgi:hypothetical protein